MKKCALDEKYNRCPDLREGQRCARPVPCPMQETEKPEEMEQAEDRREPRWYEKYYEGKSRRI